MSHHGKPAPTPASAPRTGQRRRRLRGRRAATVLGAVAALTLVGCSGQAEPGASTEPATTTTSATATPATPGQTPDPVVAGVREVRLSPALDHLHGLLATADGTLLAGTHSGVVVVTTDGAVRPVGTARDDLMGMTGVPGSDRLFSSGHPGAGSTLPNPVGLIVSDDGGLTWSTAALTGEVDFHALATDGSLVVGYDGRSGLLVSTDGGASFTPGATLAPAALAVTPGHVWATTADGVQRSTDQGRTFAVVDGAPLLVLIAAGPDGSLWGVDTAGLAWRTTDGTTWEERAAVGAVEALAVADHATAYAMTATTLYVLS